MLVAPGAFLVDMAVAFVPIDQDLWGYRTAPTEPAELIDRLAAEVRHGIDTFKIIAINHERCGAVEGYERVNVELRITDELFNLFMNGNAGYRAQYAQGIQHGEAYNRAVLEALRDLLTQSSNLFGPNVDSLLCRNSLEGPYTKFWFPKSITDPSAQEQLLELPEVIRWPPWVSSWSDKPQPRKGLLAPMPEDPALLLNGSFVRRDNWLVFEQKRGRSDQLAREGWT
jgi:hypothetical protein